MIKDKYLRLALFIIVISCMISVIVPSVYAEGSSTQASKIPESFPIWILLLIIGVLFTVLCVLAAAYFFRESKRHASRFISMNRKRPK